jgi:hypothetical protein
MRSCEVCGQNEDDCICPECPICQGVGDPFCYIDQGGALAHCLNPCSGENERRARRDLGMPLPHEHHGLVRSFGQVALLAEANRVEWEVDHPPKERFPRFGEPNWLYMWFMGFLLYALAAAMILAIPALFFRGYLWSKYGIDPYFEDWHWHWRH